MLFATNELHDPHFTWPLTFVGYRTKLYLSSKVFAGRNIRFIRRHFHKCKPGIEREQALAGISCSALCCHSNETRAPIANLPNSVHLEGTPYHYPSYIRVRAVVWECGEGQTNRHTDVRDQYAFRGVYSIWHTYIVFPRYTMYRLILESIAFGIFYFKYKIMVKSIWTYLKYVLNMHFIFKYSHNAFYPALQ